MALSLVMVLTCLVLAFLLSQFFKWLRLPKVVGQIAAGFILSSSTIHVLLFNAESLKVLDFLANLGIILLFFYIGLELNLSVFIKNFKSFFILSVSKAFFPLILGFLVMKFVFGFNLLVSLIVGISLSAGALSVSTSLLEELKLLRSKLATALISIGIITDVIELLFVGFIISLFEISASHVSVSGFFFNLVLFVLFAFFARLIFIPYAFKFFDKEKSSTVRFMFALIIVFFIVSVSEFFCLGTLIGAVTAGMIIRQAIYKDVSIPNWEEHDIARSIHIISFGFLIPLFFVWIGLNTDFSLIFKNFVFTLVFVFLAFFGIVGGTVIGARLTGSSFKKGFVLGLGLTPKGDIGFVLAALALKSGIISYELFSSLVLMAVIVTVISPIMFRNLVKNYFLRK
ncbi:hypothetical protein DRJ22_01035 [Candidatus Woesearchaeota archaeon]|nr:MAG: hypothetical protein B6U93_01675 [Candidatus Woesearchaeota archaeon ex4484_78]RLE46785.1 MAG: hypothetical protein DRJ22_01035 [Candidatus Woesearchaeota archaeon]